LKLKTETSPSDAAGEALELDLDFQPKNETTKKPKNRTRPNKLPYNIKNTAVSMLE
jgi:hypothetical protein